MNTNNNNNNNSSSLSLARCMQGQLCLHQGVVARKELIGNKYMTVKLVLTSAALAVFPDRDGSINGIPRDKIDGATWQKT
jgi:hypothetical protein